MARQDKEDMQGEVVIYQTGDGRETESATLSVF